MFPLLFQTLRTLPDLLIGIVTAVHPQDLSTVCRPLPNFHPPMTATKDRLRYQRELVSMAASQVCTHNKKEGEDLDALRSNSTNFIEHPTKRTAGRLYTGTTRIAIARVTRAWGKR